MLMAAAVFSDNMVLQRDRNVRIFGKGDPGKSVYVSVPELNRGSSSVIGTDGGWEALLSPMNACDRCSVEISSGNDKIVFSNVAVGEVWLAGGQSNMEFELRNEKHGRESLAECGGENVRFYYTPKCGMNDDHLLAEEAKNGWAVPSEKNSELWSAVGYYFAKELSRKLRVTVGVIGCNLGGTSASAWMDRKYLECDSRLRPYIDEYDKACVGKTEAEMIAEYDEYTAYHSEWEKRMQKCYETDPAIKWDEVLKVCGENRYPGPMGCKNPMRPCGLYETMIRRVCPYTLAGFIYYQGESDDHRPDTYYYLMKALIENWRNDWRDDELPFIFVQLPMFKFEADPDWKNWAKIREAQMRVYKTVKNTGIAVALDCGEFNNIHPVDKTRVAHRLYLQAMYHVYGGMEELKAFPPIYRSYEVCGNSMLLKFEHCDGFEVRGKLNGFELAGADGEFHTANAEIDGSMIRVSSERVERPESVRYLWTNYAEVTLFGRNGLPVPPFGT